MSLVGDFQVPAPRASINTATSLKGLVERSRQVTLVTGTSYPLDLLPFLEHQQSGQAEYAVAGWGFKVFFGVDLYEFDLAIVLFRQPLQDWGDHFAGGAPFGPEVHHNRKVSF